MERLREKLLVSLEDTRCISELIELRDVIRPDIGPAINYFKSTLKLDKIKFPEMCGLFDELKFNSAPYTIS